MIFEIRTYDLLPGSLAEVLQRFGRAYEHRRAFSPLAAFWFTEIGPLNQIIHVWAYADFAERARVRAEAAASGQWPPSLGEFITAMNSEIFEPSPFTPGWPTGELGPYFELRSYGLRPAAAAASIEAWRGAIDERRQRSPLIMSMYSDIGGLNKHVHIWAYNSLDQRAEVREKAKADGVWPPEGSAGRIVSQENKILLAADFSPLR
ncbi:MAG: hypothetical protein GKR94_24130 [Gammaproteobacteria bacterium]|nr:hypothetical protein [Gammaproteobacteria bacterium]